MPRRGRPKSRIKKEQIHQAAIDLFTRNGYEGTSMDDVAQAANVSKQTVYSHFSNKQELFNSAIVKLCEVIGLPADLDSENRPLPVLLNEIGRRFLTLLVSDEAIRLYRLVVGQAGSNPDVGRTLYETGPKTFIDRLEALFAQRAARGEIDITEPRLAAAQFFAMLRGELHMRVALGVQKQVQRKTIDHYVSNCVDVFIGGHRA